MQLILCKGGDTDSQKVKAMVLTKPEDHEPRALILYFTSGDMAIVKFEAPGELAELIKELQG